MTTLTAPEIAERLGFTPKYAQTWLYQAKKRGFLAPVGTVRKGRRGREALTFSWEDVLHARRQQRGLGRIATLAARRASRNCGTGPASFGSIARLMEVIDQVFRGETWPAEVGNHGQEANR